MTLWNKTRDGRWVMPCNVYPKLRARATTLLRCDDSVSAVQNAMLQWRADELRNSRCGSRSTLCDASVQLKNL